MGNIPAARQSTVGANPQVADQRTGRGVATRRAWLRRRFSYRPECHQYDSPSGANHSDRSRTHGTGRLDGVPAAVRTSANLAQQRLDRRHPASQIGHILGDPPLIFREAPPRGGRFVGQDTVGVVAGIPTRAATLVRQVRNACQIKTIPMAKAPVAPTLAITRSGQLTALPASLRLHSARSLVRSSSASRPPPRSSLGSDAH